MNGLAFFDTNLLIYADDASVPEKQSNAIRLITDHQRQGSFVISLQVIQEYFAAATNKLGVDPGLHNRRSRFLLAGE